MRADETDDDLPVDFVVEVRVTCSCGAYVLCDDSPTVRRCPKCGRPYQVQAEVHVYRLAI